MKKLSKRIISFICLSALVVGAVLAGTVPISRATDGEEVREWVLYESGTGMEFGALEQGLVVSKNDAQVQLPDTLAKQDLVLRVTLDIKDDSALAALKEGFVELAQETCDVSEIYWNLKDFDLQTGEHTYELPFTSAYNFPGTGDLFDLTKEIKYFRVFTVTDANDGTATLMAMKIVDISESGLLFGETDTYLQLSEPLDETPEVIEASIKMDAVTEEEEEETVTTPEWTLVSAGDMLNTAVTDYAVHFNGQALQTATTGTVATGGEGPDAGAAYTEITVQKTTDKGGTLGFCTKYKGVTTPEISSEYTKDDLAVAFWLYSPNGKALPNGVVALSSNGWAGDQELRWFVHETVNKNLKAGWNYIQLDLSDGFGEGSNTFDYTNINYMFWTSDGNYWSEEDSVRMTDIKLIVKPEPVTVTEHMGILLTAGDQLNGAILNISNVHSNYLQEASTGTVGAGENGPEEGTVYSKSIVKVNGSDGGCFGFWAGNNVVQTPTIPEKYEQSDLYISFWLWSPDGAALPGGAFVVTNDNWAGANEMRWWADSYINPNLKAGWNYIELGLGSGSYSELNGNFDYTKINHAYWYSDGTAWTAEKEIRITNINLIGKTDGTAEKIPTVPAVTVATEEVDSENLIGNQMIFSNTNTSDEPAYALYVTEDGDVALLWGTTQYTLENCDVRTGDWVDIKVVHDEDDKIVFYINDELKATSKAEETEQLEDFTIAHCIGADVNGGQLFNGRIAKLHLYSDANATDEIGNWALKGDIQYVLIPMTDTSDNNNTAVYRGSRAMDWIDYEIDTDFIGEDYWSILFIPDIQNLTQDIHGYDQTWYQMADWIADSLESENVKHVIGAGDSTWDNLDSDYAIARKGFDKFTNLVSWSNMVGNHEYNWSVDERDSTRYQQYFSEEYITSSAASDTYMGSFNDPAGKTTTENSYYRFSVNGVKWMILQLEYYPRISVLEWAEEIANSYPEDNIILTTHGYIDGKADYITSGNPKGINSGSQSDGDDHLGSTTEPIWNTYLKDCENIKLILCGHSTNGTGAIVDSSETNTNGDAVPVLMINAQDKDLSEPGKDTAYYDYDPLGMISILRFSADGTKATVQYYSPTWEKSFSPADLNGARNSNDIAMEFDTEACSHTNTTMVVNQNNADVEKEGYTGDTYCKDCDTILTYGTTIPAEEDDGWTKDTSEDGEGTKVPETDIVEESDISDDKEESPDTGDYSQSILWIALIAIAGMITFYLFRTRRKGE